MQADGHAAPGGADARPFSLHFHFKFRKLGRCNPKIAIKIKKTARSARSSFVLRSCNSSSVSRNVHITRIDDLSVLRHSRETIPPSSGKGSFIRIIDVCTSCTQVLLVSFCISGREYGSFGDYGYGRVGLFRVYDSFHCSLMEKRT